MRPNQGCGSEIHTQLAGLCDLARLDALDVEIDRVYISQAHRSQNLLFSMFYPAAQYLLENTPYRTYLGICSAPMARIYRTIGAHVHNHSLTLRQSSANKYFLINGFIKDFHKIQQHKKINKELIYA